MRIGIAVKPGLVEARETLAEVSAWLKERGVEAVWTPEAAAVADGGGRAVAERVDLPAQTDVVLVLGGDGTLLAMAKAIAESGHDTPILAVNFGSLGFLTEITRPEIFTALDAVIAGRATHDLRMMLRASAKRRGHADAVHLALNDIVFTRTAISRMIELSVSVGDQFVTTVKADGLIVATPTGSTAYNLAAGGPIVHPSMDALVLTPIAPHTLTNRPVMLPASAAIEIVLAGDLARSAREETYVTFDGQTGDAIGPGDTVSIHRAPYALRLLKPSSHGYFQVLRQKLRWAER